MIDKGNDTKGAGVKFPPPLVFILWMLGAFGVHYMWPMQLGNISALSYVGLLIITLGFSIVFLAALSFKRAKTHIEPWKPTTNIVSTGVFAYSRNPIYIGFSVITISVGILSNSLWILLSFIPSVIIIYFIAIKKEEAYLEIKFGEEYIRYKEHTRRWL